MKRIIYAIFLSILVVSSAAAQSVTATWSLLTNTSGSVSAGGLTLSNQNLGSAISGVQYGSTFGTVTGWQRVASTVTLPTSYQANSYVEYAVTVPAGKKITISNINFSALGGGTSGARMAVFYSLNGFLNSSSAGAISYNNTSYANDTGAGAVSLLNTSTTPLTGQEVANINTNIEVGQNKTFTIRIYVWAGSTGRYFTSKDFKLTGVIADDTTPVLPRYTVNTIVNNNGAGTVIKTPNSTDYEQGSSLSIQAVANFGYRFVKWINTDNNADLSTANPYVFTVNASQNITAVFETLTTYSFTLNKIGSNWGEVNLSPAPTNGRYVEGTEVTMTVIPNRVTSFSYWDDNSTALQKIITINSDKTFTATFDEIPFIVGWDFKAENPKINRTGDFYSESSNTGLIAIYEPNGTAVNWLSNTGSFSPAYPNLRFWTAGTSFNTTRRYLKAQFATTGYKNIQVKSMITANYQAYSVQKLQYSLDDISYTDVASVDITSVYNTAWKDLNVTLPVAAEGQARVYLKWIADTSSPILGNSTDNDGTAFTNIFVFADKEIVNDTDAPLLISTVPVSSSSTATINGSIVLTFNEKVKLGTGNITLGSTVLTPVFGSKTATFAYEKLNYNTSYTFTVPAGALTDMSGNPYAGTNITFTTASRTQPTRKLFDAVVAKDGSGDYTSVIDAIAAAPTSRTTPWVIFIKNGKYTGHHDIPTNKPFIHLIGQSRNGVIISDNRLSGANNIGATVYHVSQGATMVVNSKDCYFENIIFENSYGFETQAGPQALALYTTTDKFAMNNCYLRSYQDTYLTAYSSIADRHYIKNSRIEGAVDFIYGGGDVFFDKDTLTMTRKDGGYIVAPSHGNGTAWGYVFSNCVINESVVTGATSYFGRPWQNAPKTVFINTKLLTGIYAAGWYYKMGAIPAVFADYNTVNAQGNPVDLSQRISNYEYDVKDANGNVTSTVTGVAKKSLTDTEAASYTYENVILRSGDVWDPRLIAEAPDKPANLQRSGNTLSWNDVPYTRLYVITRNNNVIGFSLTNSFTDNTAVSNTNYTYTVQAASEYGALSLASTPYQTLPLKLLSFQAQAVRQGKEVALKWTTTQEINTASFDIERSVDGQVFNKIGNIKAQNKSGNLNYQFTDFSPLKGVSYYRLKQIDLDAKFEYSPIEAVDITNNQIIIYPNPVSSELAISHLGAKAVGKLSIFNSLGKEVLKIDGLKSENQTKVDVSTLQSGVYFIQLYIGKEIFTSKFIKQ
ncbi:pectinesterase family protein [Pedobacter glucosidilyticus]|uniref:pectinesterase family protein n=1 Tax=Pedobacter glucosidilyticus TaxID=1122941 RepID=UPI00041053C8|nr:pectinesterase family protein [Pedobacter glucosidilyticus]